MASSNFVLFNGTSSGVVSSNTESDALYLADTTRTGGITTGEIFASPLANKMFYQWSCFVYAFSQMMLVAVLANVKTAADFLTSILTVSYSGSIAFDATKTAQWWLTLTGNVTASTLTGQVAGQQLVFILTQDATGGRTFSWPSNVPVHGTISALPNVTSIQLFDVLPNGTIYPIAPMIWVGSSGIVAQGSIGVVSISATGSVSNAYAEILENVTAGAGVTRTLYNCVGFTGFKVNIAKVDSSTNPVTIAAFSGQTIDGFASIAIYPQYNSFSFISDGVSNWTIV
jgi:hypothetical protein